MNILKATVNWNQKWGNAPDLTLTVDRFPRDQDLVFTYRDDCWFAEQDGYARFYAWRGPGNNSGFGGSTYTVRVANWQDVPADVPVHKEDGYTTVDLRGPWSSRPSQMTLRGFTPTTSVILIEADGTCDSAHYAGAVTVARARQALAEFLPKVELVPVWLGFEPDWELHFKNRARCLRDTCDVCGKGREGWTGYSLRESDELLIHPEVKKDAARL